MNTWFAFAPSSDATRATKDPGANLASNNMRALSG